MRRQRRNRRRPARLQTWQCRLCQRQVRHYRNVGEKEKARRVPARQASAMESSESSVLGRNKSWSRSRIVEGIVAEGRENFLVVELRLSREGLERRSRTRTSEQSVLDIGILNADANRSERALVNLVPEAAGDLHGGLNFAGAGSVDDVTT